MVDDKMGDGLKKDLSKVVCDMYYCLERGEYGRCYLDIHKNCLQYVAKRRYDNKNRNKRN